MSAAACLHGPAAPASAASRARGGIVVPASANVCVAVHVDQRISPLPDAELSERLSGHLMPRIRRIYEQRAGLDRLPGTQNEARFVSDGRGINPACQDRDTDVFVTVRYGPRRNGTPFVMSYRIARGTAVRTGRIDFDVVREMRAGRIWGYSVRRTIEIVIAEDLWRRAPMIADQLIVGRR